MLVTLSFIKLTNPDNDIDSETLNPDFKENMFIIDIDLFYVVNENVPQHLEISYYVNFLGRLGSNGFQLK